MVFWGKIQCKNEMPIFKCLQFFNLTLLPQSSFRRLGNLKNHLSGRWIETDRKKWDWVFVTL